MVALVYRGAAWRWLLPLLVVLLVLGHVCDLEAFAELADHHATATGGHTDELLSTCDAAPATPSSAPTLVWVALDVLASLPTVGAAPVREHRPSETSSRVVHRPPLFLLHASLLT